MYEYDRQKKIDYLDWYFNLNIKRKKIFSLIKQDVNQYKIHAKNISGCALKNRTEYVSRNISDKINTDTSNKKVTSHFFLFFLLLLNDLDYLLFISSNSFLIPASIGLLYIYLLTSYTSKNNNKKEKKERLFMLITTVNEDVSLLNNRNWRFLHME